MCACVVLFIVHVFVDVVMLNRGSPQWYALADCAELKSREAIMHVGVSVGVCKCVGLLNELGTKIVIYYQT